MSKMFKVTDADKKLKNEAWKRFIEGHPNYMYIPLKKAKFQRDPKTEANT